MAKNKTNETSADVLQFIDSFADTEQKKLDSYELLKIMKEATSCEPKMWGPSIIGFGNYHYKYDSGHEGDAPLIGFSPRKAAISLYVYSGYLGFPEQDDLLKDLGKFKIGKACIYVKKLSDIDMNILQKIMQGTIQFLKEKYGKN